MGIEGTAMDRGKIPDLLGSVDSLSPRQHQCPIREGGYITECLLSLLNLLDLKYDPSHK